MQEIETKILDVNVEEIKNKLNSLGAKEIQKTRLVVDWYGPKGLTHDGDDPWFLRVRSYTNGNIEVTCKWNKKIIGNSTQGNEINVLVDNHEKMGLLFESIGLEHYAHQEKDRISWVLGSVQFDLDTYPSMPSYLEIEVKDEKDINQMIKKLNLEKNETWNDGERTLIKGKYKLDWFNVRF
jgi:adenylate cyclase class 2